jgi:sulfite dehydrogenase (quinone) subunit SoeA
VPIRPGTDGALLLALANEIIAQGLYDRPFVARDTNGGQLVIADPAAPRHGLLATDEGSDPLNPLYPQNQLWWDRHCNGAVPSHAPGTDPYLFGDFRLADGTRVRPAFHLLADRLKPHTPEWAEKITGIPAATIRRLAHEMGVTARDEKIGLPIAWTVAGAASTPPSPVIRWRSTPCAALRRTRTASTRCARSPS